jgi:leucyl-tRNA synthetase
MGNSLDGAAMDAARPEPGVLINSGEFTGLDNEQAKIAIADRLERDRGWASGP